MFVRVAVNIPSDKTFTYTVPEAFRKDITVGKRVLVPLDKRRLAGYIIEITSFSDLDNIKEIIDILDFEPLFNKDDLTFYQWVSQYYIHPIGKTLSEILPGGIDPKTSCWITLVAGNSDSVTLRKSTIHIRIMDTLAPFPNGMPLNRLKELLGKKDIYKDIHTLQNMGLVHAEQRTEKPKIIMKKEKTVALNSIDATTVKLTNKQRNLVDYLGSYGPSSIIALSESFGNISSLVKRLAEKGIVHVTEEETYRQPHRSVEIGRDHGFIIPNEHQEAAFQEIMTGLKSHRFSPYLLHGVTGSGKTEVYLNAIEETLRMKGGVICLVPEIALTPQLLTRFKRRFQDREIAILHSGISKPARYDQWRRIQRGDISIVVGARSALFAPVRNLKLIIVDEEHDTSYKQDDRMRYNARDLAIMKAKLLSATVVVGSATPAIQTYFNTMMGKNKYLVLPERVEDKNLPDVEIVDMKHESEKKDKASLPIISRALREAIQNTLEGKKQILLFLNRRGFHTFLFCPDCGHVIKCLNCAVTMTHHASESILKCHYCDFTARTPSSCPVCRGNRIMRHGAGTERLEEEIGQLFPHARIGRMDSDTTAKRGSYEKLLQSFDRHEIDILIGTQMITKGHDFPEVTLVGIISADASLNLPDFRAGERTFQLLTQAAGRGGRGDSPGRVIIQTFNPEHYAITRARNHDYLSFYGDEIRLRKTLSYPPYSRIVNLHLSSTKKEHGTEGIEKMKRLAEELIIADKLEKKVTIIGPAESPVSKIKGRYRWQLLLKGRDTHVLNRLARNILSKAAGIGLDIKVDVDPVNFM